MVSGDVGIISLTEAYLDRRSSQHLHKNSVHIIETIEALHSLAILIQNPSISGFVVTAQFSPTLLMLIGKSD